MPLSQRTRTRIPPRIKALLAAGVKHADLAAVAAETAAGIAAGIAGETVAKTAGETAVSSGNAATATNDIIEFAGSKIPSKQTKNGEINTNLS
jgi:hypothetical protein